eukprot:TRINITY_DN3855_c0_g1_i2.p1 TRINITY_DN3855_c0_g1~~TRINITY_DN3855_c0_g1_i2.p1  ORF type:complete len:270 (-),score=30.78 TRINITY_DN3855_c0_g1_i2:121-930(-)
MGFLVIHNRVCFSFLMSRNVVFIFSSLIFWWNVFVSDVSMRRGHRKATFRALVLFNVLQMSVTAILAVTLSFVGSRWLVNAIANVLVATFNILLVVFFCWFANRIYKVYSQIFKDVLTTFKVSHDAQLRKTKQALQMFVLVAVTSSVCFLCYTGILIVDAVHLFAHQCYPGDHGDTGHGEGRSYAYTEPVPVLYLYRVCEITPAILLLCVLMRLLVMGQKKPSSQLSADAQRYEPLLKNNSSHYSSSNYSSYYGDSDEDNSMFQNTVQV